MQVYVAVVVMHWLEHLAQAVQVYALGWPREHALGAVGFYYPWLVHSEWFHYVYALVMLMGLILLRPAFVGRACIWWDLTLWLQVWHHLEHAPLLGQALTGSTLFGAAHPLSIGELVIPRVELHLFYNTLVTAPMIVAGYLHTCPTPSEAKLATCTCHRGRVAVPVE